jgi:hypothetical protein
MIFGVCGSILVSTWIWTLSVSTIRAERGLIANQYDLKVGDRYEVEKVVAVKNEFVSFPDQLVIARRVSDGKQQVIRICCYSSVNQRFHVGKGSLRESQLVFDRGSPQVPITN